MQTLAFDLGGTSLRCALIDDRSEIVDFERTSIPNIFLGFEPEETWRTIIDLVGAYADRHKAQVNGAPIVVSFPGPVRGRRVPLFAPTISGPHRPPADLVERLRARTATEVYLINDLSAAAWLVGDAEDVDRSMIVTVSSGIGSKVFDRFISSRVIDDCPYAGEIGHVVVDVGPDALVCDCGQRGHLGAIASGRGVERLARRIAAQDTAAFARSRCTSNRVEPEDLTNEKHLVPAARAGDQWTWDVIRRSMAPLAGVLAVAAHVSGLERIIVIGGFALAIGQAYAEALTDAIAAVSSPDLFECPARSLVRLGHSDDEVCLRGAGKFGHTLQLL